MNILLWVLQVALAFFCIAGGTYKINHFEQIRQMNAATIDAFPRMFWTCVGAFETLAGICLVVPGLVKLWPAITPTAAACLAVESLLLTCLFVYHRDLLPAPYTVFGAVMAAFIAYGRFVLRPL